MIRALTEFSDLLGFSLGHHSPMCTIPTSETFANIATNITLRDLIEIQPFEYDPWDTNTIQRLLVLPDELLLEYTSTSPKVEASDYADNMRELLKFMLQNQSLLKSMFKAEKSRLYKREPGTGQWVPVDD